MHPWRSIIIGWLVLLSLGLVGMVLLYTKVLPGIVIAEPTTSPVPATTVSPVTDDSKQAALEADIAQLSERVGKLELQATASTKGKTVVVNNNTTTTVTAPTGTGKIRETFLPMGGGSTDNRDWTNMTGAQIMFDPSKFGKIVSVRFEAAGYTIGGEVHARLIDVTHNTIYYNTELMFNTNSPTWKRSAKFSIPSSPVTFQVQLLSTSGEMANLQDSRLVIEIQD